MSVEVGPRFAEQKAQWHNQKNMIADYKTAGNSIAESRPVGYKICYWKSPYNQKSIHSRKKNIQQKQQKSIHPHTKNNQPKQQERKLNKYYEMKQDTVSNDTRSRARWGWTA